MQLVNTKSLKNNNKRTQILLSYSNCEFVAFKIKFKIDCKPIPFNNSLTYLEELGIKGFHVIYLFFLSNCSLKFKFNSFSFKRWSQIYKTASKFECTYLSDGLALNSHHQNLVPNFT